MAGEKIILRFSSPDEADRWEIINDGVMGGLSRSRMDITGNKTALFQGEVSLENNGGFASVRTLPRDFNLEGYTGLMLVFRGDGKTYRLRLRTDDTHEGIAYQSGFETVQGKWVTLYLPFDEFIPFFRGHTVEEAPPLDLSLVRRIGFMIAEGQEGPFRLEIKEIGIYGEEDS